MLCSICDPNDLALCELCRENANFVSGTCQCDRGYYPFDNGQFIECKPCSTKCVACTSQTACTACVASSTRLGPEDDCACQPGFYEVGTDECAQCSTECAECETTSTTCTVCDTNGNFVKEGTTCQCIDGYYKVIGGGKTTCELCHYSCLTCETRDDKCTQCKELRDLNGLSQCPCREGYIENNQECVDDACTGVDPNCQVCEIIVEDIGKGICEQCISTRLPNSHKKCACKAGSHEVGGTCVACGEGCQVCTDINNCHVCAFESDNNKDGTCSCPKGTYIAKQDN